MNKLSRTQLAWMRHHWYAMPLSEVRAIAACDIETLMRALSGGVVVNLQTLIEEAGYETRSYSGRCMYGATCLAFTCDEKIGDVFASLLDVISGMDEEGRDEAFDLASEFRHMKSDSMGRGSVYYFEGVPFEGDSEDADEEESEEKLEALS